MAVYKIVITAKDNGDILHESDPIYESRPEAMRSDAYQDYYGTPVKKEIVPLSTQFRGALFKEGTDIKVYGPVDPQDCRTDVDSILEAAMPECQDERKSFRKEIWEVLT